MAKKTVLAGIVGAGFSATFHYDALRRVYGANIMTRLKELYVKYGGDFNFCGFGNFFGQIGEIRISNVRRYH